MSSSEESGTPGSQVLEALKFLCESNRSLHEGRIGRELTLVVSIIPFFIVSAGFVILNIDDMGIGQFSALAILGLFVYLGLFWAAFTYLHTSGQANLRNQRLAETAEDEIVRFLKAEGFSDIGEFLKGFPRELFEKQRRFDDLFLKYAKKGSWLKTPLRWKRKSLEEKLKRILDEKRQQQTSNQEQGREEGGWKREDFHPARQRWFWYVEIVGLTAGLCYLLILVFGILHFCRT